MRKFKIKNKKERKYLSQSTNAIFPVPEMLIVRSLPLIPIIIALLGGVILTLDFPTIDRITIPEIKFSLPTLSLEVISSIIKNIFESIGNISLDFNSPKLSNSYFDGMIHSVSQFFQNVLNTVGHAISITVNSFSSAIGALFRAIIASLQFLGNIIVQTVTAIIGFFQIIFNYIFGAISNITNIIAGFFANIFNTLAIPFKALAGYLKTQKPFFDYLSTTVKFSFDSMKASFADTLNLFSEVARASQY